MFAPATHAPHALMTSRPPPLVAQGSAAKKSSPTGRGKSPQGALARRKNSPPSSLSSLPSAPVTSTALPSPLTAVSSGVSCSPQWPPRPPNSNSLFCLIPSPFRRLPQHLPFPPRLHREPFSLSHAPVMRYPSS